MIKIVFFILLSVSSLVHASKARVLALGNSFHLLDSQTVYKNPIDAIEFDNFVVFETGVTNATNATVNAEAMASYVYKEDQHLVLSFGHQDQSVIDSRNFINLLSGTAFELPQNPLNIFYGINDNITSSAFGFFYSKKDDKILRSSESSAGLSLGIEMGKLQISSLYTFINRADGVSGKKFDGSGYWQTTLSYLLDETLFQFQFIKSKAKLSTDTGSAVTENESHVTNTVTLGLVDSNVRDEDNFFWGVQVISTQISCNVNLSLGCDKKFTNTVLPVWFGIEAQASEWLIVRATLKQSFLVNITKDDFGYPLGAASGATGAISSAAPGANDTVVSTGLGFKFKRLTLDGTLATSTTQTLNTSNFLSQVGLTYNF